jgi:hypothetical protein
MDAPRRFPFTSPIEIGVWSAALVAVLALLAMPSTAMARDDADNPNRPDDLTPAEIAEPAAPEMPWQEEQSPLPIFPRAADLLPIRGDAGDPDYKYYIDVNSVSLSADEVLRYTVVIQSPRGASNIVYEGIRCATNEIKTLAYGTRDGRFKRMPNPEWTYVHTQGPMGYRTTLVELYVCDENGWAMSSDTVLERLVMHDPRRSRVAPKRAPSSD